MGAKGRPLNFDCYKVNRRKKCRVVPLHAQAVKRKCSASRARHNDAASNAVITRAEYAQVHYPRMGKAALVKKADNAINAARKKTWRAAPRRKPPAPAVVSGVRYYEHDGVVQVGTPIEVRLGRKGAHDFVVLKRHFEHRKRDRRVACHVAVPFEHVIDTLPRTA